MPLLRRPLSEDTGNANVALTSAGITIADHTVFVSAASGPGGAAAAIGVAAPAGTASGFILGYRLH